MVWTQDNRKKTINKIVATLRKIEAEGLVLDEEALVADIMYLHGASQRTAKDYVKQAKFIIANYKDGERQE